MQQPMDCKMFIAQLDAYMDSELTRDQREAMNAHAAACPDCGERLETMTRLLTMCAELDEGLSVPLEAQAAWRKAIRQENKVETKARKKGAFRRWVGGIAAALMLLTGGTFVYRGDLSLPAGEMAQYALFDNTLSSSVVEKGFVSGARLTSAAPQSLAFVMEADGPVADVEEAAFEEDASLISPDAPVDHPSVVLRTAQRTITSSAFDQTHKSIQDLVSEYQGYFEEASVSGQSVAQGGQGRSAYMVARVPTQDLDSFLISLDAVGDITSSSESAEDISDRFYDTQARLESYRAQLDRLNQLMGTAANLEDMLLLEDKRTEVMQEIDSLEGQLAGWTSRAQRSSVYISLEEVQERGQLQPAVTSLEERIRIAFYDSINWLKVFLQDCAVVLAMAAPVLVVAIPAIIVLCLIISGIKRRRRRRKGM